MYLLRIVKEKEFDSLEEIIDKYPNAIPVNTFSHYEDIYEIKEKDVIDKIKPEIGQLIRFIDKKYDRCYIVLKVEQEDIDNGIDVEKPGLYGFGGMWYGCNRWNKKSYGNIVELDLKDYPWVIVCDSIRNLDSKTLKKLVD
jgi:hypothetical protein